MCRIKNEKEKLSKQTNTHRNEKLNKVTKVLYETGYFSNIETAIQDNVLEVKVIENPIINQVFFDSKNFNLDKNEALKRVSLFLKSVIMKEKNWCNCQMLDHR